MAGAIPTNPADILKQAEAEESATFSEQCYLLDYIDVLSDYNKCNSGAYKNFIPLTTSDGSGAYEIISKLASRTGLRRLTDIRPADLALLQPKVKIEKCIYDSLDGPPTIREIKFPEYLNSKDIEEVMKGKRARSGGAGLKEFSWSFAGTNPAEADKLIDVSMKLSFQSPQDFLGKSYNTADGVFNLSGFRKDNPEFIDLILHPPTREEIKEAQRKGKYEGKLYKIKATVGWNVPDGDFPTLTGPQTEDLKAMLRTMNLSMYLNLVSHELTIKENGALEVSVDYVGSLETAIDGNQANVLAAAKAVNDPSMARPGSGRTYTTSQWNQFAQRKELASDIEQNRNEIKDFQEKEECASQLGLGAAGSAYSSAISQRSKENKKKIEALNKLHAVNRSDIYRQFISALRETGKMRILTDLGKNRIKQWEESLISKNRLGGALGGRPPLGSDSISGDLFGIGTRDFDRAARDVTRAEKKGNYKKAQQAASDFQSKMQEKAKESDKKRIHYMYFGDILDVACTALKPEFNSSSDNMTILTGPVVINHPRDNSIVRFNLADLPIPLDGFLAFFMESVVKKQLDTYPLKQFLKDILEKLVRPALKPATCFQGNKEQRNIEIGQTIVTISNSTMRLLDQKAKSGRVNISRIRGGVDGPIKPLSEGEHGHTCMLLYLTSYSASELRGNIYADRQKGIFHYTIGQDRGLLRKLDFKRNEVQGLREARQADDRNLGQLRDIYNANVTLVGNNIYIPGMKIFLNPPFGFGSPLKERSLSHTLGIGGYYDVIKVNSTISRGGAYTTDLECIFAQSGARTESVEEKCEKILGRSAMQDMRTLDDEFEEAFSGFEEAFGNSSDSSERSGGGDC